jgi:ESS family glutamate:Na+ symporter
MRYPIVLNELHTLIVGLASMPVAFATMEEVTSKHGPSPRAFLLITLVGSFFVDLANAVVTKAFLLLPMFG